MTELLPGLESATDVELISRARAGDTDAFGQLFSRHVDSARRLARQLAPGPDADDLVSEAFTRTMSALRRGAGPDVSFRAYLLTTVRRAQVDRARAGAKVTTVDDDTSLDVAVPFTDTVVGGFENAAAAQAFASLPERWQLVLWHLEVEGERPADVAPLLGMSPNAVSALAYRAREGLRQAFLTAHLAMASDPECQWVTEHLGGYVRDGLSARDRRRTETHLAACPSCATTYAEADEVNNDLAGILIPALLGASALGYTAAPAGTAGAAGVATTLLGVAERVRDGVVANPGPAAAGAAVTVAAVTALALGLPSTTGPLELSSTEIDATLARAAASADALVIWTDGLPEEPATVLLRMSSRSGQTGFGQGSDCQVDGTDPTTASCPTGTGRGGRGVLRLYATDPTFVVPLAFPADLRADRLSITLEVEGYADLDPADNTVTIDFVPVGSSQRERESSPKRPTRDPSVGGGGRARPSENATQAPTRDREGVDREVPRGGASGNGGPGAGSEKRSGGGPPDKPSPPDQPSQPVKPSKPVQPDTPASPGEPRGPNKPDKPDKPWVPPGHAKPPQSPADPPKPAHPHKPSKPDKPDKAHKNAHKGEGKDKDKDKGQGHGHQGKGKGKGHVIGKGQGHQSGAGKGHRRGRGH